MKKLTHEEKILQNIEELCYCTDCLQDYLGYLLVPLGQSWQRLCPRCYRIARERATSMVKRTTSETGR
jgi:hypothetical protein